MDSRKLKTNKKAQKKMEILAWGDQGDGTYRNPVLFADFSDPDVIRVGEDFYLTASDFHYIGLQVLHSKDLVNWTIAGQVCNSLNFSPAYDNMARYGRGIWAPSIRFHNNHFYIYACTPDEGLFMWRAQTPEGPWSDAICVKAVEKWEDPCPFWDEETGRAYLVHSKLGAGPIILHRMTDDGTELLDDGREIYYGKGAEGPKMFKRNGWHYISLPENGVFCGSQVILRSRNIYGPYERKVVLPDGSPFQGGMVELDNGEGWFIGYTYMKHLGRVCHLVPYVWKEDDWPEFGYEGRTVAAWKKPGVGMDYPLNRPQVCDDFDEATLNPIWQWNHNPVNEKWSLVERTGFLRLKSMPAESHEFARNTITQKIWDTCGVAETKLDTEGMAEGQKAGMAFLNSREMGWLGVERRGKSCFIVFGSCYGCGGDATILENKNVWLREEYVEEICRFAYSFDGRTYIYVPVDFRMKFLGWKAGRIGLYSFGPAEGNADFDYFKMKYGPVPPHKLT